MNIGAKGIMLVKSDRIMDRIKKIRKTVTGRVSQATIDDLIKAIEVIVTSELTEKGVEKK